MVKEDSEWWLLYVRTEKRLKNQENFILQWNRVLNKQPFYMSVLKNN